MNIFINHLLYMDIIYKKICIFKFILIEKLDSSNLKFIINNICDKFIIYTETQTYNLKKKYLSPKIIFNINNKFLTVSFSHLYYDAYSIFYILNLLDEIYLSVSSDIIKQDEILDTDIWKKNYHLLKTIYKDLKINKKNFDFNYLNLLYGVVKNNVLMDINNFIYYRYKMIGYYLFSNFFNLNKPKVIYVDKNKISTNGKISTIQLFEYLKKKIKYDKYNIFINARKIYKNYNDTIKNFIYVSDKIKNTDDIKNILLKNEFEIFTDLKYKIPSEKILINSYMSFILPSFCKKQICDDILLENIFIFPHKLNDKYIKVMYRI